MGSASDARVIARGSTRLLWQEGAPPELNAAQRRVVDKVWERGVAQLGDALHDSPILVHRGHETQGSLTTIHGDYQPYRYYYAQCRGEDIDCGMNPIGVSGLTVLCENGVQAVVLGQRGPKVAWYSGAWECVPSGGVDRSCARRDGTVDFAAMLLREFEEETCLSADTVRRVTPCALILDPAARTYDVCCELELTTTRDELVGAMSRSEEYSEVLVVAEDELEDCLRRLGDELIPLSRALIEDYREAHGFS